MNDEEIQETACLYALGVLTAAEADAFEAAMRSDAELESLVAELRETTAFLTLQAPTATPSKGLKYQILAEIKADARPNGAASTPAKPWTKWVPWALAAGFAIYCGVLQQQAASLNKQLAALERENDLSRMTIAALSSTTPGGAPGMAVVVWDKEKQQGVLTVEKLPPPNADQDYQLWIVDANDPQPVSAGLVGVDSDGMRKISFKPNAPISGAQKFAISLERKGGVAKVAGPIVLISK